MILFTLLFLLGDVYLQTFASLPSMAVMLEVIVSAVGIGLITRKHGQYRILGFAFAAGFLWSTWYAASILSWTLSSAMEGKPLLVRGNIVSLPVQQVFGQQ